MSDVTRIGPFLCMACGYMTNAVGPANGSERPPNPNDLCFCLNCAHPTIFTRQGRMRELTLDDYRSLDPEQWEWLSKAQRTCTKAHGIDLVAKQNARMVPKQ